MKDLPILPQGLPAVFLAGSSAALVAGLPTVIFILRFCGRLA